MPSATRGSGKLDQIIVLQRPVYGDAGAGGHPISWSDIATIRGCIEVFRLGGEAAVAEKLEASHLYNVTVRNRADITAADRLKVITMGDLLLNIRSAADPGPRELYRDLIAEAGTAQ